MLKPKKESNACIHKAILSCQKISILFKKKPTHTKLNLKVYVAYSERIFTCRYVLRIRIKVQSIYEFFGDSICAFINAIVYFDMHSLKAYT